MNMDLFIEQLLKKALESGIEAAEVYLVSRDSFRAMSQQGDVSDYTVNSTGGLSLRGLYKGKMGYAATEAPDEGAIEQLISAVIDSASLIENDDVQEIFQGDESYPEINQYNPALDQVDERRKIDFLLDMEKKALSVDERIVQVAQNALSTGSSERRIVNTYGMNLKYRDNNAFAYTYVVAKEGERVSTGMGFDVTRDFDKLDMEKIVGDATRDALFMLSAKPVTSGKYRVIIQNIAMPDLLACFSSVFSAEEAQRGTSLLAGKEGTLVASDIVTLMDDPLLKGGLASCPFDDEGVAARTKAVIENGKLTTLLHNLKTARKAGVASTGNASKAGYTSPIEVSPSNFFFKPGEKTLDELMQDVGEGLVITEVSGLHAGANVVSGDFSLLAQGYTIENGKKGKPVERVTVAGNFFEMLKNIRAIGSDLIFPGSPFGSPSVDIGEITVAGE